jgi:hypothetical protein
MPISESAIPLLMQIPLAGVVVLVVGIFLWFIRDWSKNERDARATESNEERKARAAEQESMREFLAIQSDTNNQVLTNIREQSNQALKDIREQSNAAIARLAEEMKANTSEVSKLTGILIAHDAASKERNIKR